MARKTRFLEIFYHLSCLIFYTYVLLYGIPHIRGHMDTYLGQHKFMTIQCLYFQVIYYTYSTLLDILASDGGKCSTDGSRILRDYFFTSLLFPLTTVVSVMFWAIALSDHQNACPPEEIDCFLDFVFSNHALHTAPVITSFFESVLVYHKAPWGFLKGIMGWMIYITSYISMVYWIAAVKGFWVYTYLSKISPLYRVFLLFGGCWSLGTLAYAVCVYIVSNRWSTAVIEQENKKMR